MHQHKVFLIDQNTHLHQDMEMKRLELKNKFSCKTITKSTGPSFYRNGRAACPHRSLIAVVRNNSLTRQKNNWEKLLCGCFMKDFRSKHICFSLTSSKAYAENFSDIFHKRSTWMPYSRKTILKSERSASINELNADYSKSHTAFRLCLRKWLIACISALHYLCIYLVTISYTESLIRANEPSSYCDKACGMSSSPKSCSAGSEKK